MKSAILNLDEKKLSNFYPKSNSKNKYAPGKQLYDKYRILAQ